MSNSDQSISQSQFDRRISHHLSEFPFLDLPVELWVEILLKLSHPNDLISVGLTCKALQALSALDACWQAVYRANYAFEPCAEQSVITKSRFRAVYESRIYCSGTWCVVIEGDTMTLMNRCHGAEGDLSPPSDVVLQFTSHRSDPTYYLRTQHAELAVRGKESILTPCSWWQQRKPYLLREDRIPDNNSSSMRVFPHTLTTFGCWRITVTFDTLAFQSVACCTEIYAPGMSSGYVMMDRDGVLVEEHLDPK